MGAPATPVTIDAIAAAVHGSAVNTISLTMTVGTGNALLASMHFGYSGHSNFAVTWVVGGTTQTLGTTANFDLLLTSDNGLAAPAIALAGLLNPTPGSGTLTVSWSSAADNVVIEAVSLNNVNALGGLSGAFVAAVFATGTSTAAALTMPAILGGIQFAFAGGKQSSGAPTGWAAGPTSLYVDSSVSFWGAGAYQSATAAHTFTQNIASSEFWAIAGVVANPASALPSGTIVIDSGNSIASGLTAAIPCWGNVTLTDLVSAKTATPVGCSTDTSGGYGGGLAVPGGSTTAKADFGVFQPIPNGDYTLLAFCNPANNATQGCPVGQCDSGAAGFIDLEINSFLGTSAFAGCMGATTFNGAVAGADDNQRQVTNGSMHVGMIDGHYHAFASRVSSGTPSIWCDGANTTIDSIAVSGTYVNGSQHFAVGNLGNYTSAAFSANCTIVLVLVWNRALSDAEMASITADPFQVLASFVLLAPPCLGIAPTAKRVARRGPFGRRPTMQPASLSTNAVLALFASTMTVLKGSASQTVKAALSGATAAKVTARAGISGNVSLAARTISSVKANAQASGRAALAAATSIRVFGRLVGSGAIALFAAALIKVTAQAAASGKTALGAATRIAVSGRLLPPGAIALFAATLIKITGRAAAAGSTMLQGRTRIAAAGAAAMTARANLGASTAVKVYARAAVKASAALAASARIAVQGRGTVSAVLSFVALAARTRVQVTARALMSLAGLVFTHSPRVASAASEIRQAQPAAAARLATAIQSGRDADVAAEGRSDAPEGP